MSKKNSTKGTARKTREKKTKTRRYRPMSSQAYSLVRQALASDTELIDQEAAQLHLMDLEARIKALFSEAGGDVDTYECVSDTALLIKVAIDAGFCDDDDGQFLLIRGDLSAAVDCYSKTGRFRLPPESLERIQQLTEAIKALFETLPERTFISLHRATTTVKRAVQRGEILDVSNLKEIIK